MKAIIYCSNTGFTKKYAEILGDKTGLPVYSIDEKSSLEKSSEVVFLGWTMAGGIKGYDKALKKYNVTAVCAVGMASADDQKQIDDFMNKYDFSDKKFFYLQGGYDYTKLKGMYRFMMGFVTRSQSSNNEQSPEQKAYMDKIRNGFDSVSEDNLKDVIDFVNQRK